GTPTTDTLFLMDKDAEAGLDAAAVVLPTHVPETNTAILDFYTRVNDVGIPFMVYQPPAIKTHQLTLELVAELMELSHFVGLKDSSRDLMLFSELCYFFGDEISVIQGVEMLQLPALVCGSAGIVGGGANLYPGLLAKLNTIFAAGDLSGSRAIQHEIIESWRKIVPGNAFRTWVKQVWQEKGVIETSRTRMDENKPLASPEQLQQLLALLDLGETPRV
ncbi:dihydrodipicolinate synthase family protein, partial [bacterium]|nr:dihydrodipicolinate synthase family protein [bacterium]